MTATNYFVRLLSKQLACRVLAYPTTLDLLDTPLTSVFAKPTTLTTLITVLINPTTLTTLIMVLTYPTTLITLTMALTD